MKVYIDGAARGNPGPAAYGFAIFRGDQLIAEENGRLGSTTNNVAEYTALVRALECASSLDHSGPVVVHSDSELLVKQMNGEYRVKNARLRELFEQAKKLAAQFGDLTIRHVPRSQNTQADRLCNEALDGKRLVTASKKPAADASSLRETALACLREAAQKWRSQASDAPDPEQVLDQLLHILKQN
ncbi:MAG: hypothetical protein KatS3mg105_0471 [Gemmatales bacterium]|nr:MAG: hypothetical protein KatS3mg105_0471 [Gemmatales bacterium]